MSEEKKNQPLEVGELTPEAEQELSNGKGDEDE